MKRRYRFSRCSPGALGVALQLRRAPDNADLSRFDPENGGCALRGNAADMIGFEIDVPAMSEFGRR